MRKLFAPLSSLAGLFAAASCCLPLPPLLLAAGAAGAAPWLKTIRPYLLGFSVIMIAFGFWQARRAAACDRRTARWSLGLLWFAAVVTGTSLLFPQALANLVAGSAPAAQAQRPLQDFQMDRFAAAFDREREATRIVVLLSPT